MRKNNKRFRGFTLAEMLVTLAIVGIIAAAVVPIAKPKAMKHNPFRRPHGIVECFYDSNGNLIEYFRDDKSEFADIRNGRWRNLGPSAEFCEVTVPDSDYYKLHVINAGTDGEYNKDAADYGYDVIQKLEEPQNPVPVNEDFNKNMEAVFKNKNAKYKALFNSLQPQVQFTLKSPQGAYGKIAQDCNNNCSSPCSTAEGGEPGDVLTLDVNAIIKYNSVIHYMVWNSYTYLIVENSGLELGDYGEAGTHHVYYFDGKQGSLSDCHNVSKLLIGGCREHFCYNRIKGAKGENIKNPFGDNPKVGDKLGVFIYRSHKYSAPDTGKSGDPQKKGYINSNDSVEVTFGSKSITYYFGQAGRNGKSKELVTEKLGSRKVKLYPQSTANTADSRIEIVENGKGTPILSAPKFSEYTVIDENNNGSNMTIKKTSTNSISISDIEVSNEEDLAKLRENLLPYPKAAKIYAAPDKIDYVSQYRMAEGSNSRGLNSNSEGYGYKNNIHPGQGGFGNHVIFTDGANIESLELKVKTNAGEWSTADANATLNYDDKNRPVCMNGGQPTDGIYCKATSGQEGAVIISW